MDAVLLMAALVFIAVAGAVAAVLAVPLRRAVPAAPGDTHPGLVRLRRVMLATRAGALAAGGVLVAVAASAGGPGRALMLAPVVFGGCQVLGVLLADALTRGAARSPGTAAIEVRRARDLLPAGLTRAMAAAGLLLAAALTWSAAVASADGQGRPGRVLSYACTAGCSRASTGPWPGSYYSAPLAAGLLVVVALTVLAVRYAAGRPRNGADPEVVRVDGAIRRRSAQTAVAGGGVALTGSLAGVAGVISLNLLGARHVPAGLSAAAWPAAAAAALATAGLVWCVAFLLVPGAGRAAPR